MKRTSTWLAAGALIALGLALFTSAAQAQSPAGMRLYAFSSGALTVPKSFLQGGAPATPIQVPVGFFVVRHPKGNVLFDTGNNDRIITDPSYWGAFIQGLNPVRTPDVAIDAQLQKIGLRPDDIKYVVVGHMHLDHGGNVGKFPKSTLVVQKDEMKNAFWPEPGTAGPYIPGDFMMLRNDPGAPVANKVSMIQLNGDLDLFNDNSVVVKRWVGHTPGSQMMIVRLPRLGHDHPDQRQRLLRRERDEESAAGHLPRLRSLGHHERLPVDPRDAGARERAVLHRPRSRCVEGDEEGARVPRVDRTPLPLPRRRRATATGVAAPRP